MLIGLMVQEESKLLALECDTMGRTWVRSLIDQHLGVVLTSSIQQLKLLADELRKSYFLQLKRFLWSEGVEGASDQSTKSPRIFPPRMFFVHSDSLKT